VKLNEDAHIEAEVVAFPPLVPEQVQLFQLQYQQCGRYGRKDLFSALLTELKEDLFSQKT
jgi:hypothetical protein